LVTTTANESAVRRLGPLVGVATGVAVAVGSMATDAVAVESGDAETVAWDGVGAAVPGVAFGSGDPAELA
jgi:hypothetical protein